MSELSVALVPSWVERPRWVLVVLLVWTLAVGASMMSHRRDLEDNAVEVALAGARDMFRMVVLTRTWNANHGGVYVPVSEKTPPNPYLRHPRRDVTTTDGQSLTLINPAYMTRLISEIATLDTGVVFRLTSLKPLRPANGPDPWERTALEAFEAGATERVAVDKSSTDGLLRYMAPLLVETGCLNCHAQQGYQLGDVRGGISVSMRYAPIAASWQHALRQSVAVHAGVWGVVTLAGAGAWVLLRRRWRDLVANMQELASTRDELLQSEKMASLGRMVAGFAHEVNTPIGVAVGAVSHHADTLTDVDRLLEGDEVDELRLRALLGQLREADALAQSNLRRAADLIQSFKRTSIDQSSDQVRDFALAQLINDVLFTLHHELKRLPIQIRVHCPRDLTLHGLPGVLGQLLTNLVMNAVQHAFDGGQRSGNIDIEASCTQGKVQFYVRDDGLGMTAEQLDRAFEPFYTTRRAQGGSGLGLYICYNLVQRRLNGQIVCTSTPGQGCVFIVTFPANLPDVQTFPA